jgi:hypothetical protein
MRKVLLASLLIPGVTILLGCAFAFQASTQGPGANPTFFSAGTLRIPIIQSEGANYLRLVEVTGNLTSSSIESLDSVFLNVSSKPITAYHVVYRVLSGDVVLRESSASFDSRLVPGDLPKDPSTMEQLSFPTGSFSSRTPPNAISIIVDFVEFADGTSSGKNQASGRQVIQAQRVGAQAILRYLRNKYLAGDIPSVEKALGIR